MSTVPSRALLEVLKWLRVFEIATKVELVCTAWRRIASLAELWAYLLEQELLLNRTNPMCLQDYPSLAAKYISSKADFVEFWKGAKEPPYLIYNSTTIALHDTVTSSPLTTPLVYMDGFRAVIYQDHFLVVMGFTTKEEYRVTEYDTLSGKNRLLANCLNTRVRHAIVADKTCLYITGGEVSSTTTKTAEMYDGTEWAWLPSMNYPTHSHTMVLINSRLFVFGGTHDKAELYTGESWIQLDLFLPIILRDFGVVVKSFKSVILVGGLSDFKPNRYVYQLDLMTGSAIKLAQYAPLPVLHNAVHSSSCHITFLSQSSIHSLTYSLRFPVTVRHPSRRLETTIWLEPSDTVSELIRKAKETYEELRKVRLAVCVEGQFAYEELSVIAADITPSSHVLLLEMRDSIF